jgi:hypothetical protein
MIIGLIRIFVNCRQFFIFCKIDRIVVNIYLYTLGPHIASRGKNEH